MWSNEAVVDGVLITSTGPTVIIPVSGTWTRAVIHNRLGVVYIKLGPDASSADFTYRLNKNAILETENYGGPVSAICESGAGYIDITTYRG
jgi:hypothetical protein